MPHLHLPIDHTDADLVLAANLAEVVGSEDLYVAWTPRGRPGAVPEVEAVAARGAAARASFFAALAPRSLWRALLGRPSAPQRVDAARSPARRRRASVR